MGRGKLPRAPKSFRQIVDSNKVFKRVSTGSLLRSAVISSGVSVPWIANPILDMLLRTFNDHSSEGRRVLTKSVFQRGMKWGLKSVVFPHFCGGETLRDVEKKYVRELGGHGVRLIVDQSIEDADEGELKMNLHDKISLLEDIRSRLGPTRVSFVPIKITSLVSWSMLERVTELLERAREGEHGGVPPVSLEYVAEKLSPHDAQLLRDGMRSLTALCKAADRAHIPLLMDAEETHRQLAIDLIARELMREFNTPGPLRPHPVLYQTFQMYLRDASARLEGERRIALEEDFVFAAKVVRGAYIESETRRGSRGAIHATKEDTDACYDETVGRLIPHVASGKASLVVASHNERSVELAIEAAGENGLSAGHPRLHFAQILGMGDSITHGLTSAGFNTSKLVLYGDFDCLFPWMIRRLDENRDIAGAMSVERKRVTREVLRRLLPFLYS